MDEDTTNERTDRSEDVSTNSSISDVKEEVLVEDGTNGASKDEASTDVAKNENSTDGIGTINYVLRDLGGLDTRTFEYTITETGTVRGVVNDIKNTRTVKVEVTDKKYILRETVAPLGYTLTTDTVFSIDDHNVVTKGMIETDRIHD